jgi:TP901 family phage tail tape measure protein
MTQSQLSILISAKDMASNVMRQVGGSLDSLKDKSQSLSSQGLAAMNNGFQKTADLLKVGLIGSMGLLSVATGISIGKTIEFNSSMANVASLMPGASARVLELKDSVQQVAIQTGKSTADISGGLYQVISAFGDTADSVKILEINAKSGMAGLATTVDAINLTSAVTKAYGDTSAIAVQKASDLALMTVRLGQTTFPELAGSVGRVTPLMKQLGGSQEELFAVMATMTGVTGGAAEVSTQLAGALQSVMAPTKNTTDLMKKLGYTNGQAMIKSLGVQGSIKAIVDAANKSGQPLQSYIGSIEGQVLALGLAGPQAEDYKKKLQEMAKAAGATDAAFREQTTGINYLGFRLNQLKVMAEVFAQKLGDKLSPMLKDVADNVFKLAGGIEPLIKLLVEGDYTGGLNDAFGWAEDSKIIDNIFNIRGAILDVYDIIETGQAISGDGFTALFGYDNGQAIIETIENTRNAIADFTADAEKMEAVMVGVSIVAGGVLLIALWGLVAPILAVLVPLALVAGAIAFLYYAWQTNMGGIQEIVGGFVEGMKQLWAIVQPILMGLWDLFMNWVWPSIVEMGKALMGLWDVISPIVIPILKVLAAILGIIIVGVILLVIGFIKLLAVAITDWANGFKSNVERGQEAIKAYQKGFEIFGNAVKGIFKGVVNGIIDSVNFVINGWKNIARTVKDIPGVSIVADMVLKIPEIPKFENGGVVGGSSYTGDKILARVNSGELILNQEQQNSLLNGSGGGTTLQFGDINITTYLGTEKDKRRVVDELMDAIEIALRKKKLI